MWKSCKSSGLLISFLFIYIALAIFMYYPTVASLAHIWIFSEFDTYKHGLLLLGVGIYFFYQRWMKLGSEISIRFDMAGFLLLITASIVWFFAHIAEVQVVQQLVFIFILYFIVWTILGYRISRQFAFPILLLICAIPIWGLINEGMLQVITVKIVAFMLKIIGVNNYVENVRIFIPEGAFSVNPECAGMQQLIAAISLAAIYAYLNSFRIGFLFLYMGLAAVLALALNILRIFIVVFAGHITNMKHYFVRVEHVSLGWALFGIGMFIFMMISNKLLLSQYGAFVVKADEANGFRKQDRNRSNKKCIFQLFLVIFGLSVGPLWAQIQGSRTEREMGALVVPSTFNRWHVSSDKNYSYQPFYNAGTIVYERNFTNKSKGTVYCYIGYYHNQSQGKELVSDLNRVYDNKTWIKLDSRKRQIIFSNKKFTVNETIIKNPQGREKLIWSWYYLAGEKTSNKKIAKLLEVWSKLGAQSGASLFLVATDVNENYTVSRKKLYDYLKNSLIELQMSVDRISRSNK